MPNEKILITSALPYIHGIVHLGNIAGSLLPADVYYRYMKLFGKNAIFICGSDSHGTMFEISAKKAGIPTHDFVYEMHKKNKKLLERFGIQPTYYGITDSENNKKTTYEIFEKLDKKGYIFEKESEMFYCNDCKTYLADRWVEGKCRFCRGLARGDQCDDCGKLLEINDVLEPRCLRCGRKNVVKKKIKNLYLDLPKIWKEKSLEDWLNSGSVDSFPLSVTEGYLKQGLKARTISRAGTQWGFHIPKPGFEDHVFYVWFDAPIGYIGITKDWCDSVGEKVEDWWMNKNVKLVQFLGKDNIFFHTIFFPCILKGADERYILPSKIIGYAFLLAGNTKFSKSRGKGLSSEEALELFPADYWRFYLIYKLPENTDTTFSWNDFQRVINKELVDNFGNLVYRVRKLIKLKGLKDLPNTNIKDDALYKKIQENLNKEILLSKVLKDILKECAEANRFMQERAPWKNEDYEEVLKNLYLKIQVILDLLSPIIPDSIEKIKREQDKPPFEKIKDEKIEELIKKFSNEKPKVEEKPDPFSKLDFRIGEILSAEAHPNADRLLVMKVDFGEKIGERQIVAGIKNVYAPEELVGKKAVFLVNLKPRNLRGIESQGMVLVAGCDGTKGSILVAKKSKNGDRVFISDNQNVQKPKEIEYSDFSKVMLTINNNKEVVFKNRPLRTQEEKIGLDRDVETGAIVS